MAEMDTDIEEQGVDQQDQQQDPTDPPKKLKVSEFAAKIKEKYPAYKDMDDNTLTQKIIEKYPVYKDQVDFGADIKKKSGSVDLEKSSLVAGDGLSPSQSQLGGGNNQQSQPVAKEIDPFDAVKNSTDLRNKTVTNFSSAENGGDYLQPDTQAAAEADKVDAQLKDRGFGKDFIDAVKDLPQEALSDPNTSSAVLQNDYLNNKVAFNQKVNEAKNHWDIRKSVEENTDGTPEEKRQAGIIAANAYTGDIHPQNFQEFEQTIKNKQDIINHSLPTQEDKDKANERLKSTYSTYITPSDPDLQEEYNSSPLKTQLDPVQYAGLKTMELFEPDKYKQTISLLNQPIVPQYQGAVKLTGDETQRFITSDEGLAKKNNWQPTQTTLNEQIGRENLLRSLNNQGLQNESTPINYRQQELIRQNTEATTPEEKLRIANEFTDNKNKLAELDDQQSQDDIRYPLTAQLKFDQQAKEITQDRGRSVLSWMTNKYTPWSSAVDATENIATSLFGSDADKAKLALKRGGEMENYNASTYLPESEKSGNSPFILQASKDLKSKVNKILNGRSLSSLSKDEYSDLLNTIQDNQSQLETITNPKFGTSKNFWSKSTGMSIAGFTTDMASFMTQMGVLKGIGVGGKIAEGLSLFNPAYNQAFNQKISEGKSVDEANDYGMLHGSVMAFMAKFGSKYENAVNILKGGKSPISKEILGLGQEAWDNIYKENKPFIQRLANSAKGVAKENAKMIGTFGVAAPAATDLADNAFYDAHNSPKQIGEHIAGASKDMAIGSIPMMLLGMANGAKQYKATPVEKSLVWDLGDNPEFGKAKIDELVANKELTPQDGELRKQAIDNVSTLIKKVPSNKDNGDLMTDKDKINYLYNSVVKSKAEESAKNLPEKQAEKATHTGLVAGFKNQILLDKTPFGELQSRADKLQSDIDKKDENGKPVLNDKEILSAKAELEAVNDAINDSKKNKVPNPEKEGSIADEGTDKVSGETEESSLAKEIRDRKVEGVSDVGTDKEVINYAIEKAAEDPAKFNRDHPELFDKIKDKIPTEKLQENLDYLIKTNPDNPSLDVLDKMISERENAIPNKEGSGVGADVELTQEQKDAKGRVDNFVNGLAETNPELHKLAATDPIVALNKLIDHHKEMMKGADANTKAYSQKAIDKFEALKKDHELANQKNNIPEQSNSSEPNDVVQNLTTQLQELEYKKRGFEKNDNGIWVHKDVHPAIKKLLNGFIGRIAKANGVTHAGSIIKEGQGIAGSISNFNFKTGKKSLLDLFFNKDNHFGNYADTFMHEIGHKIFDNLTDEEKAIIEKNEHLSETAQSYKNNRGTEKDLKSAASDAEESFADYVSAFLGNKLYGIDGKDFQEIPKEILPILEKNVKIPNDISEAELANLDNAKPKAVEQSLSTQEGSGVVVDKTGLVLYHGSPHSFENFDIGKLGSGEGAQAFGHGLYFTNEPDIAKGYANKLGSKKNFWEALQNGHELSLSKDDFDFINRELDALGFDGEKAENEDLGNINVEGKQEYAPAVLDAMAVLFGKNSKSELEGYDLDEGQIKRMLEIKKKISDPQFYKVAVHEGKSPSEYDYIDWREKLTDSQRNKLGIPITDKTGQEIYKDLSKKLGGDQKASEYLLSKGIDGITYKSEKGTGGKMGEGRNYVVFDPKAIRVDEINNEKQQPNIKEEAPKEPDLGDGRKVVTLNGSTEAERQQAIEQRKAETKQTPLTENRDKILERIDKYNKLGAIEKRKSSSEVNSIRLAIDKFNNEHEQQHSLKTSRNGDLELRNNPTEKRPSGSPVKYTVKGNESSIVENATPLFERSDKTKEVFNQLLENDALPVARRISGEKMSDAEFDGTIRDIQDGIPSQRAENYLNSLEKQISEDNFDYNNPDKNAAAVKLNDILNITTEKSEPMTPEAIDNFLNKDSEFTPEDETTFDNIENLVTHYEQDNRTGTTGTKNKVQQSASTTAESNSKSTNGTEQPKKENTGNNEPPIKEVKNEDGEEGGKAVGVSHAALTNLADKLGLKEPQRGKSFTSEELASRGRRLLEAGANPNEVDNTNNRLHDRIAIARAHLENLVKSSDDIGKEKGFDSPEYNESLKGINDYAEKVKGLGTEAHYAFKSLQGERDIDTGSFTAVKKSVEDLTGKKTSPEQDEKIKELTSTNEKLKKEAEEAEAKLILETDKAFKEGVEEGKNQSKSDKAKKTADKLRENAKLHKPNSFSAASPASLVWDTAIEIVAKGIEAGGKIADIIEAGIKHIKESDWYKGLSAEKQDIAEKDFRNFNHETAGSNSLEDLQARFVDKTDNKFSESESRAVWDYAKKTYLDNGEPFRDMLGKVSNDLGLSWRQVNEAISSKKTKRISDEMWNKQAQYAKAQTASKNWVADQNKSIAWKALKKASGIFRGVAVFGHGGIFVGTHAAPTLFQPTTLKYSIPAFIRGWKFAYGNNAGYERAMAELEHRPNYVLAQRAGLKNNPERLNAEEYQKSQKYLGKLGQAGEKGFNAIKVLRQDLFDYHYNKLSEAEKADPGAVKSIASIVNLGTGATNLAIPSWVNELTFAGGMEAARWGKLTRSPARATSTALKALYAPDKVSVEDRVFAKIWVSRVGQQLATFSTMLLANAALQKVINPNNPTNVNDPNKPDFGKFKFGTTTIDPTSGMRGVMSFMYAIGKIPFETKKERHGDNVLQSAGKQSFGYGRGKLAPLYSTLVDFYTKTDFSGNPLPFNDEKPSSYNHKLTWGEYAWQKAPLPIAEAAHVAYQSAIDHGADKVTLNHVLNGIMSGAISGTTGFRVGEYDAEEKNHSPYSDADKSDPAFKYFTDKGMELPNTPLQNVETTDDDNGTKLKLTDYPKEKQKEYSDEWISQLKEELSKIKDNGNVYVKKYKDASGNQTEDVFIKQPEKGDYEEKSLDDLSKESLAQVLHYAQSKATENTKKIIFNE